MNFNMPRDWGNDWMTCPHGVRYHASEYSADCEICDAYRHCCRPWLKDTGYDLNIETFEWSKYLGETKHTARRDHKCSDIKAGMRYAVFHTRYIDDETGKQRHERQIWRLKCE